MTSTQTTRTKRDIAILTALSNPSDPAWGDRIEGFAAEILESGLISVTYKTGNCNDMPWASGTFAGRRSFANLTKLDSGESIAYTEEGKAFIAANAEYL